MAALPKGPLLAAGQRLLFEDHFTALSLDLTKWRSRFWWNGIINNELQAYRDEALRFTGDRLIIDIESVPTPLAWDANKIMAYRSGLIHTHGMFSASCGVLEARIKIPKGKGLWPALWLLAEDKTLTKPLPEIDVFEFPAGPRDMRMNYHCAGQKSVPVAYKTTTDLSAGYHVYGCQWGADGIAYYLDGQQIAAAECPVYPGPMHIVINCALGGWAGTPDPVVKQEMWVDYVRVWG